MSEESVIACLGETGIGSSVVPLTGKANGCGLDDDSHHTAYETFADLPENMTLGWITFSYHYNIIPTIEGFVVDRSGHRKYTGLSSLSSPESSNDTS